MNPKVINPYAALGTKHKDSLDDIIAHLPANPAFDDLNGQLGAAFFQIDPESPKAGAVIENTIKTILPHAYNGYVNGGIGGFVKYSDSQQPFIKQMLEGIQSIPAESGSEFLGGIEENIGSGKLSYEEQIPLLIAVTLGKSDSEYWLAQIAAPGAWATYLNADNAINNAHVGGWVSAAMQGALLAYGLLKPPQIQLVDIVTAAIGSTGLVAGKVLFGWVGRG